MRIGIIADVHGSLEALHEALRRLRGVELVVNLGDVVAFADETDACYELLRRDGIVNLIGNHEQEILSARGVPDEFVVIDGKGNSLVENLGASRRNREFIKTFRTRYSIRRDGLKCHFSHGHDVKWSHSVRFDILDEWNLGEHFAAHRAAVNFCGHLHRSQVIELTAQGVRVPRGIGRTTTIELAPDVVYGFNVGMLCQSNNGTTRLCYALLDTLARTVRLIYS
jgi:predicted phosphodiesterase